MPTRQRIIHFQFNQVTFVRSHTDFHCITLNTMYRFYILIDIIPYNFIFSLNICQTVIIIIIIIIIKNSLCLSNIMYLI